MIAKLIQMSKGWRQQLLAIFVGLFILGVYFDFFAGDTALEPSKGHDLISLAPPNFDILILDLKNEDTLDLLVDDFAIVSLFSDSETRPLVTGLKIFRAPRNPQKFVALVPKSEVAFFVPKNQQLTAVVEPSATHSGTVFVREVRKHSRSLLVGTDAE